MVKVIQLCFHPQNIISIACNGNVCINGGHAKTEPFTVPNTPDPAQEP